MGLFGFFEQVAGSPARAKRDSSECQREPLGRGESCCL
jgi:hypothetical protein